MQPASTLQTDRHASNNWSLTKQPCPALQLGTSQCTTVSPRQPPHPRPLCSQAPKTGTAQHLTGCLQAATAAAKQPLEGWLVLQIQSAGPGAAWALLQCKPSQRGLSVHSTDPCSTQPARQASAPLPSAWRCSHLTRWGRQPGYTCVAIAHRVRPGRQTRLQPADAPTAVQDMQTGRSSGAHGPPQLPQGAAAPCQACSAVPLLQAALRGPVQVRPPSSAAGGKQSPCCYSHGGHPLTYLVGSEHQLLCAWRCALQSGPECTTQPTSCCCCRLKEKAAPASIGMGLL